MTTNHLGRKPPKIDDRDFMLRSFISVAPFGQSRWWKMVRPDMRIDQGPEGTCVGHGCTNVLMAAPSEHPMFPQFEDTASAHSFARKLYFDATGDTTYQEGAYTRDALNVLKSRGQIAAYYRLGSADEVVGTVVNQGPVTFGSMWYQSMFSPEQRYDNAYLRVDPSSGIAGGHLYCITGVKLDPPEGKPFVRMQNSWGPGWGHNGTARITVDDLHVLFDGDAFLLTEEEF